KYRNENIAGKTYKRLQVNRKPECNHVVLSLTNSYGCANGKEISRRKTGNATNLCRVVLAHPFFA
uniref:Astacin domain-containing protein n=1 Tax=Ascaris lumbricoides TaxID=6252 RepID=A0A0M3IWJ1_ASCLU